MVDYLDDIVGQETPKKIIRTALRKGNLYNFLFVGPRGVGKRLLGFALARTLNCPPQSSNFLLITPIPSKIKDKAEKISEYTKHYLPENITVEVEDRTSILIEQIRTLIERLVHMPKKGSWRVVLILEADRMTDEAANCFLKTLEEPPIDTVFILTTSRAEHLLPTIRSRCQVVSFNYLRRDQIKNIIFEGIDEFHLGSPGEILSLRESNLIENVKDIFQAAPLDTKVAAIIAKDFERKKIVDLFYPLLLLYRMVLYKKLNLIDNFSYDALISSKVDSLTLNRIIDTISMLNHNINILEQNPNRLLQLFDVLLQLA